MIRLFCFSGGWSNDLVSSVLGKLRTPYRFTNTSGVLGELTPNDLKNIAENIREDGYHVFKERLSPEICQKLLNLALTTSCSVRPTDAQAESGERPKLLFTRYTRENPIGVRYDVPTQALLDDPIVQKLISDLSILSVAQAYLGAPPVIDIVTMWWHTSFSGQPSKQAAQYFHFDMDRLKWLKFFFYITDVTSDSGPHCFIAKSHRRGGIPRKLLRQGYTRLTDEEVKACYKDKGNFVEFIGPMGTILAEDTRGLHKGKHVQKGDRLIFQLEFANSLFGSTVDPGKLSRVSDPNLQKVIQDHPKIFSAYLDVAPRDFK